VRQKEGDQEVGVFADPRGEPQGTAAPVRAVGKQRQAISTKQDSRVPT